MRCTKNTFGGSGATLNPWSRADIHDGLEQTNSNHRPDTLMQDRSRRLDENLLQRTAGPYIGVNRVGLIARRSLPVFPDQRTLPTEA
jgi:hypothetical protein